MKEKTRELFELTELNQILLFNRLKEEPYFYYFTSLPLNQLKGSAIILKKGKKPLIAINVLEYNSVKKNSEFKAKKIKSRKEFVKILQKELTEKKIGINYAEHSPASLARLRRKLNGKKLLSVSKELKKLRETKTKSERKKIKKAVKITENTLKKVPELFEKKMSEKELAQKLEIKAMEKNTKPNAFPIVVASAKNTANPHHITSNKKIGNGFLLIDFGIRFQNYCSDLTRTYYVGKASEKEKELYKTVFEAKQLAEKKAKPGVNAFTLFNSVNSFLQKKGFELIHSLGHGIGLQAHDFPPGINKKSHCTLKEKMCLALEPAVYGEFGGIRIEDNYVIKNGLKQISKAPRELIEL